MEKSIYFIDDSIKQMIAVMKGQFPELWFSDINEKEGVKTNIIILGNGYKEYADKKLYSEEEEIDFQHKMEDLLFLECKKLQTMNPDENYYFKKRELVKDSVKILFKQQMNGKDENGKELELYQAICSYWQKNIKEGEVLKEEKGRISELIQLMQISPNACVGIDMALFYHDIERTKEGKCIISMELYNQLKKNHKCFIYSGTTYDANFIEKWTETYKKYYCIQGVKEVYKKLEMRRKRHDSYVFESLMELLNETDKDGIETNEKELERKEGTN